MRGRDDQTEGLFNYVNREARVPPDHPLRQTRAIVDEAQSALNRNFAALHALEKWRPMRWISRVCLCCVSDGVPRRSFIVALIVGTILNLINQGDALLNGTRLNLAKLLLTYAVPYCVATYGAVSLRLATMRTNATFSGDGDESAAK